MVNTHGEKRKQVDQLDSSHRMLKKPRTGAPGSHLADLLARDTDGIIIARSYMTNNGFLNQQTRKYLVHLIINSDVQKELKSLSLYGTEQLQEFKIPTSKLITYSNEIAALFPSEDPKGYFNPYRVVAGVRKEATGRLWEHYNYMKTVLREQGVLIKRSKEQRKKLVQQTVMFHESVTEKLKWLETNSKPLEKTLATWRETFDARRELLSEQKLTVSDYYAKFMCLRMQEGVCFIQSDFMKLHPNEATALQSKWDVIKGHLILKLQSSKAIRDVEDKVLLLLLPTLTQDQQVSAIFHLLPVIVPQNRSRQKKKSTTEDNSGNDVQRLSLQERRDSFTLRVSSAATLDAELARFKEALNKNGLTFQPIPVVVGTVTKIEACYVAVDDMLYKTNTYMDAIDLTFKIFFVTSNAYPERSRSLWQLLEKGVYGIDDQPGKCQSWIQLLAGELKTIVTRHSSSS